MTEKFNPQDAYAAVQQAANTVSDLVSHVHRAQSKLYLALAHLKDGKQERVEEAIHNALAELGVELEDSKE